MENKIPNSFLADRLAGKVDEYGRPIVKTEVKYPQVDNLKKTEEKQAVKKEIEETVVEAKAEVVEKTEAKAKAEVVEKTEAKAKAEVVKKTEAKAEKSSKKEFFGKQNPSGQPTDRKNKKGGKKRK